MFKTFTVGDANLSVYWTTSVVRRMSGDRAAEPAPVVIQDEDRGFDAESLLKRQPIRHLGLHGMRERVALLERHITIGSRPESGTSISIVTPIGEGEA